MIETCLADVYKTELGHPIKQSRKSKILRHYELVNEIKTRKRKFQLHKTKSNENCNYDNCLKNKMFVSLFRLPNYFELFKNF